MVLFFFFFSFVFGMFFFEFLKRFDFFYVCESIFNVCFFFFRNGGFDVLYGYTLGSLGDLVYFFVRDIDKGFLESISSFGISFFFLVLSK